MARKFFCCIITIDALARNQPLQTVVVKQRCKLKAFFGALNEKIDSTTEGT
jgi:hypothetical protein